MKRKFQKAGKELREFRLKRGFTQREVAELIGCHTQFVSNAERSLCLLPKPNMRQLLVQLGITQAERKRLLEAIVTDCRKSVRSEWKPVLRF